MDLRKTSFLLFLIIVVLIGCKKDEDNNDDINQKSEETFPVISSIVSDNYIINIGGDNPAIITCNATGGNLSYLWEVDLGDIFLLNDIGSQVSFTGSGCCVGDKYIKCTVSNSLGSVMDTVVINVIIP